MIIYGWNSKNIRQAPLAGYVCTNCGEKQSQLAIFASYVHIFWIPVFAYRKSAIIHCDHCRQATEEGMFPITEKEKIKQMKSAVPIPKYLFIGGLILLLLIGYFVMVNNGII